MSRKTAQKTQRVLCGFCAFLWLTIPRVEPLRFEVTTDLPPASGRLFVILSKSDRPEPRTRIGETGVDAPPILGRDIKNFGPGVSATIDRTAVTFPIANLDA